MRLSMPLLLILAVIMACAGAARAAEADAGTDGPALETFQLYDGRSFTGVYEEDKKRIRVPGPLAFVMPIELSDVAKRRPATAEEALAVRPKAPVVRTPEEEAALRESMKERNEQQQAEAAEQRKIDAVKAAERKVEMERRKAAREAELAKEKQEREARRARAEAEARAAQQRAEAEKQRKRAAAAAGNGGYGGY